ETPVGERRNGEPRYIDQCPFVVECRRKHGARFGQKRGTPLRRLSFEASGLRTNKLFALLFRTLALRYVVAGQNHMIGRYRRFGPSYETRRAILCPPVILSIGHVLPWCCGDKKRTEYLPSYFFLRIPQCAFKCPALSDDFL